VETRNWIGGEWITPQGGTVAVWNPSDRSKQVGVVNLSESSNMIDAGTAAHQALPSWAGLTGSRRGEHLFKMALLLEQKLEEVATLASSEMGKPISEMRGEVMRGVHILRYYAGEGVRAIGSVIPATENQTLQYTKRIPLGVVGLITPWNFPVAIPIWKMAPALISGNTVIWKPAEIASLTATKVTEIFAEAGLPGGVLNLVVGKGRIVGQVLLEEVALDGVSFTGSTSTGQQIAVSCAKRNIKFQTEMGGKNAAIILRDADLSKAVPALISGAFRSAGQKCTATSRIIAERAIFDPLSEALNQAVSSLRIGSALDPASYLGPVASQDQQDKVMSYVKMAKQGQIIAEGAAATAVNTAGGHYVMPLIVSGFAADHPLVQEEIFGPVTTLLPADDFEHSLALCNQTVYGLTASVFTQDLSKGLRFLDEAQAGMVRINQETAGVEYQAPFGGMKWSSSHTREQGQAAVDFYSQVKTCAVYYGTPG